MNSNPRSPVWPYLLVLTGLFALTMALPRSWQGGSDSVRPEERSLVGRYRAGAERSPVLPPVAIMRPTPDVRSAPPMPQIGTDSTWLNAAGDSANFPGSAETSQSSIIQFATGGLAESVARKIADFRQFVTPQFSGSESSESMISNSARANQETADVNVLGSPNPSLQFENATAARSRTSDLPAMDDGFASGFCPVPRALMTQLDRLMGQAEARDWAGHASDLCRQLCTISPGDASGGAEIIHQLQQLADQGDSRANLVKNDEVAQQYRRATCGLQRRLALWNALFVADRHPMFADIAAGAERRDAQPSADVYEALTALEQYESSGLPSDARKLAAIEQTWRNSSDANVRQLGTELDRQYRNANVRVAISGDLLNRILPDPQPASRVVNDTILGASVKGISETKSQLNVKLVPDPEKVHLWFEAQGVVDSQTQAMRGPATITSRGEFNFVVRKAVLMDQRGMVTARATAMADGDNQVTGVRTNLDGRPLAGSIARRVASSKEQSQRDEVKQEVDQRIANQAEQRLDAEVDRRLQAADAEATRQVLGPLAAMDVPVVPLAFETTPQRISVRMRLAGANQLGGQSARPLAPSDSLLSTQIHESALNNILDQLQLAGRTFTAQELFKHIAERISQPNLRPAVELPSDVSITFANDDPIRIRCQDGLVRVTLAISNLRQGGQTWHDFQISTTYVAETDHLHSWLVRQGPIELGGETYKGRPEVALRGIFSKLLPKDRKIDLMPQFIADSSAMADLAVNQCVVEDGWIGLAIGPSRTSLQSPGLPPSVMVR